MSELRRSDGEPASLPTGGGVPRGLRFEVRPASARAHPARADIACFVGFAAPRPGRPPRSLIDALREMGWSARVATDAASIPADLPVLIESYAAFDSLFDPVVREGGFSFESYLSGAVRDFFAQGGRRCWVVPVAPVATPVDAAGSLAALDGLLPGFAGGRRSEPAERTTWRGLGHLFGLPEVAFVAIPDLPAVLGAPRAPAVEPLAAVVGIPAFTECVEPMPPPPTGRILRAPGAPRAGAAERVRWRDAIRFATRFLRERRPDISLVAALPLPTAGSEAEVDPLDALVSEGMLDGDGIATAWVQVAWPWVRGGSTASRPGGVAPADGVLAGMIARGALSRGSFRSIAGDRPEGITDLQPRMSRAAERRERPVQRPSADGPRWDFELALEERVCLFTTTPSGIQLLSDTTLTPDPRWRQGGPNRLLSVVRRTLQRVGERFVFQSNGPQTWTRLRRAVTIALEGIDAAGGFGGGRDRFSVVCDRRTMTQADLDAGRLLAQVEFVPVATIERITVVFAVADRGMSEPRGEGA